MQKATIRGPRRFGIGLLVLLLVAGSGGLALVPDARAQPSGTISFSFWGDPAEGRAYEQVIAEFEELNPDVTVQAIHVPGQEDYQTRTITAFSAGTPPDVFLINYRRYGQYAARDALEPLGPRLRESETLREEDFFEIPMEAFRYHGEELYCIPQNISSLVVYYNVDKFQEVGVPLPADDWTWEDFVSAAEALTRDLNGDGFADEYGVTVDPTFIRYAPFIWGAGGEIVDDVDRPTELLLDTPEAKAGIQWFMDLGVQNHFVVPTEPEVLSEDDESRFMNGRAAMLLQSRRVVPTLREIEDFTWDVAPLPRNPNGEPVGILHSDAFCMAAASENKEAAWAFIEYAVGEKGQITLAETGRTVPSLKSVAESEAFLGGGGALAEALGGPELATSMPANSRIFIDTIPHIRRVPSISTWPEVEEVFNTAFKRAFYVEIDLDGAIDVVTNGSKGPLERAAQDYPEE